MDRQGARWVFPTPPERLVDGQGRPYFLWDVEVTLSRFEELLRDPDPEVRAHTIGRLMRQAKPDDVFTFVRLDEVVALWPRLERYLGRTRDFWAWLIERWTGVRGEAARAMPPGRSESAVEPAV